MSVSVPEKVTGYQIAMVSRLTGLPVDTIRAWERRYALVKPARDGSGIRQYSEAETARLTLAREATELGHPIRRVAAMTDAQLRELIAAGAAARAEAMPESGALMSGPAYSIVRSVELSIRRYDAERAERWLEAASSLLPPERFVLDVLAPLMREIGTSWELGELSIAQEHLATNVVRNVIGGLARKASGPRELGTMLFATPPGDEHAFGIELASCLAATRGFPICVLGANVPAAEVLRASRHVRPSTVVIGSIRLQSLADFVAYVSVLDGELAPETQLWIGGPGIPPSWPEKWSPRVHHVATLEDFIERL